jgi:hypothetical protein
MSFWAELFRWHKRPQPSEPRVIQALRVPVPRYPTQREWEFTLDDGRKARGACTVFYWYPSGDRCESSWERFFGNRAKEHDWKEERA